MTAAQQNASARTGVPVFASTVTRDAGFGGTGEKTLAEGQLCYVEGTGLQTYNGSTWVTWGTAPTSGLAVVKAETSFSAASSVTADNIFTSTYTNYILVVRYQTSTTNNLLMRLRASATSAATNYNWNRILGADTTVAGGRAASQTSATIGGLTNGAYWSSTVVTLCGPQLAEPTTFTAENAPSVGAYTGIETHVYTGNHSTATAYDGIELLVASGNTTGSYTVYGMGKS